MKKHGLILLFMAFIVSLSAQKNEPLVVPDMPIDENTKLITFQERVDEKGTPQELYDRAMVWVKQYYKNTTEVIKSSDRDKAVIELRSSVKIFNVMKDGSKVLKNVVYYNFKIECRQDRYRYTITNFNEKDESLPKIRDKCNDNNPIYPCFGKCLEISLDGFVEFIQIVYDAYNHKSKRCNDTKCHVFLVVYDRDSKLYSWYEISKETDSVHDIKHYDNDSNMDYRSE
jgi:hypothetical protein